MVMFVAILEAKHGVLTNQISVLDNNENNISRLEKDIRTHNQARLGLYRIGEIFGTISENFRQSPKASLFDAQALVEDWVAFILDLVSEATKVAADGIEQQILLFEHRISFHERYRDYHLFIDDARFEVQQMVKELETMEGNVRTKLHELYTLAEVIHQNLGRFQAALAKGERLLSEREVFRKRAAADVQDYRYQDLSFRTFRNDAVQRYRATFELAARYAYLAATAYDYETNLLGSESGAGQTFLTDIVRARSPSVIIDGEPVVGRRGLSDPLARLGQNFAVYKG